jgi:hypothetical protein
VIYKPYFKYSNYRAYIQEHRYIYHIYLSIKYNRIIYLPKSYEVHHINGDKKDNRIENLMLLTRKQHKKEHRKDMSGRICNICNQKTTYKWYNDIIGFLCRECYNSILYYKYKFGII